MAIFGQYQGGDAFNVAGNMDAVLKQQAATNQSMLDAVSKFNQAREEMTTLQQQTGAIMSQYGVDEKGKPDDTAPKYVHDLFKNVNKEGGIANLSRTQLVAGLKAYETGTQVDAQRQNQAFNAEKLRQARLTNDITEMQMQAALKAEKEAQRIREAYNDPELKKEIEAIAKEKLENVKEVTKEIKVKGEKIKFTAEEISPYLDRLNKAKAEGDKNAEAEAYDEIGKLLHGKTSKGRETNINILDQLDENGMLITEEVKNPDYIPYRSVRDAAKLTERKVGQNINPTIPEALLRGIADEQLKKYNLATAGREENEQARLALEIQQNSLVTGGRPVDNTRVGDVLGLLPKSNAPKKTFVWNNPEAQAYQVKIDNIDEQIANLKDSIAVNKGGNTQQFYAGLGGMSIPRGDERANTKAVLSATLQIKQLEQQKKALDSKLQSVEDKTRITSVKAAQSVASYSGGEVQASEDTWKPVIETVQKKYQRTLDEQTNDEYLIMKNYFEKTGGVPPTFTKEAFYASKGIQRPMVVQAGGGYLYAQGPDGKGHFLKDESAQSSQMSITDQEKMWKAGEFSKARNLNGLTVNGYTFRGEVRVGDIDQANKVKDGVFKTTRALSALDSLIDIADNKGLFEKLLPTEVSGIAQALANTVQAANRTEVGGSGAWSNQDQANIDKIIRDPSKGHNAIFTSQTVASLKAYRARLEQSMVDSGSIYGFAFERNGGQGSMSSQVGQFRIQYATGMAKFGDHAQALEYAKQSLNFDANE